MGIRAHIVEEAEQRFGHIWKVMAVRGLLGIAFGVILLGWPGIGLTALIALFGAFALLAGIATIGASANLPVSRGSRAWLAIDGLLAIAVAVVVLIWPDLTARALLFAIAAIAVATGVLQLGLGAFALPVTGTRALLLMLGGVVSTLFGIVMFAHPGAGALALLSLIAAFALVTGAMQVTLALELRRLAEKRKRDERPRTAPKAAFHG
jgi:uncharacterized membrane protein HdeD (DUF308 family)